MRTRKDGMPWAETVCSDIGMSGPGVPTVLNWLRSQLRADLRCRARARAREVGVPLCDAAASDAWGCDVAAAGKPECPNGTIATRRARAALSARSYRCRRCTR